MFQTQIMKALFFPNSYVRNPKSVFLYLFSNLKGKFKGVLITKPFLLLLEFHVLQYKTLFTMLLFSKPLTKISIQ